MRELRLFASVLLSVSALLFPGCSKRQNNVEQGIRDQVLHRSIGVELGTHDPHLIQTVGEFNLFTALFETLLAEDPKDLTPVPGVAERWDVSPDGTVYTFHLRKNAKWSNGDALTAQHFADSFRRILSPSLRAEAAHMLYLIKGAEAFNQGTEKDFSKVGVEVIDPHTLRISLHSPSPTFLAIMTYLPAPVHTPTIEKHGGFAERENRWTKQLESYVGNGPFVLSEIRRGQKYVLKRSSTYWDAATVRLKEIHLYTFDSLDSEERAFRTGQIHLTDSIPPARIAAYRTQPSTPFRSDPYFNSEFYRFNLKKPFVNDPKVRHALSLAVDRQTIVDRVWNGAATPSRHYVPAGSPGYQPPDVVRTDYEAARAKLAEAGYPGGKGAPTIEITFNKLESNQAIAETIQETWRRELGLDVKIYAMEFKSLLEARTRGEFQIIRGGWIADYPDPVAFLELFTTNSTQNHTGWSNAAYDELVAAAGRERNDPARKALLAKAETILLEAMPILLIYHRNHNFLIHPAVRNWHPTVLDHHPYKHVYLEKP